MKANLHLEEWLRANDDLSDHGRGSGGKLSGKARGEHGLAKELKRLEEKLVNTGLRVFEFLLQFWELKVDHLEGLHEKFEERILAVFWVLK